MPIHLHVPTGKSTTLRQGTTQNVKGIHTNRARLSQAHCCRNFTRNHQLFMVMITLKLVGIANKKETLCLRLLIQLACRSHGLCKEVPLPVVVAPCRWTGCHAALKLKTAHSKMTSPLSHLLTHQACHSHSLCTEVLPPVVLTCTWIGCRAALKMMTAHMQKGSLSVHLLALQECLGILQLKDS